MKFYSPLRYPGGKNKLARFIAKICVENNINGHYVEPYAGGASVALYLLLEGKVSKITINDFDRSIYAFWHSVLYNTNRLCRLIKKTEVNVKNWKAQKQIQNNKSNADLLTLGFSTFFLNRTNVSGIINGGIIGGLKQEGKYKIDCRFNKAELIKRIKEIAKHRASITLYDLDAADLIKKIQKQSVSSNTIFYFDPPYYLKGKSLYTNHYKHNDHEDMSKLIKKIRNIKWVVSYDNTPEIKKLYKGFRIKKYYFFYTAREAKLGNEVLFFSKNLFLPKLLNPTRV